MVLGTSAVQQRHPGHHVRLRGQGHASTSAARAAPAHRPRPEARRPGREGDRRPGPDHAGARPGGSPATRSAQDLDQDDVRSFAADVLMVFGDDEKLWCETIAARLAESIPARLRRHHQGRRGEPAARPRRRGQARSARPGKGAALRLRAGRRRGSRGARRCVAVSPGCVALPQHALTCADTASAATAATPRTRRWPAMLRCCGPEPPIRQPAGHMGVSADGLDAATQRHLRPVREAPRPAPRVRLRTARRKATVKAAAGRSGSARSAGSRSAQPAGPRLPRRSPTSSAAAGRREAAGSGQAGRGASVAKVKRSRQQRSRSTTT